jgi:hypothetical protein
MTKKKKLVLAGLALVLAALAGGGAYFYFVVVRATPRAHRHLPRGCNVAVRLDAYELLTFKPVREHLWPVLWQARKKEPDAMKKRLERIRITTGIRLPEDLREAVIASVDGTQWVAAFGGRLEPGRFVDGVATVLAEEGFDGWSRDGDLLVHRLGAALGQADDGTLVVGTGKAIVRAALPERDADPEAGELPVSKQGAVSFMLSSAAYRGALARVPDTFKFDTLEEIDRLDGVLTLGEAPRIDLVAAPKGVSADKLASDLDDAFGKVKLALLLVPADFAGGKQALGNARTTAAGNEVRVTADWPYEALDRAIADWSASLAAVLAQTPPPQ